MSYDGPVIDSFFHPGWAATTPDTFGDRDSWEVDPMRSRVMRTFGQAGDSPNTQEATTEQTVAEMDEVGITHAIFQASMYYQEPRGALDRRVKEHYDIIQEYPDRFSHVGSVLPPRQGPGTYWNLLENPDILRDHKEQYGISGVHLLPSPWGTPPNDKWFYPLFAACVELDLVVYTYVGMPGPLWPTYPNYPLHLDDVALAFPTLKIVAHHIGDPWVEMMTHLAAKHPNLYIATSAWSPKRYPDALMRFLAGSWHGQRGAEKVLFGTDYPLLNLTKAVGAARQLDLPEDVLQRFLHDNTAELHGLA